MGKRTSRRKKFSQEDLLFYKLDRERIWKEQGERCKYCNVKLSKDELTMDHVIPISVTGFHSVLNCVVACADCNHEKGDTILGSEKSSVEAPKEKWEEMIYQWKASVDERLKRFEYDMLVIHPQDRKGGFKKWKAYWAKRGKW